MEKTEKETTARAPKQPFYFNEDGKLIIESNKGVIVDGENIVKLNGIYSCNSKTMAQLMLLIEQKGVFLFFKENDSFVCADDSETAKAVRTASKELDKRLDEQFDAQRKLNALEFIVNSFNSRPWYKRIFKKIEY